MELSMIVVVDENGAIGYNNGLLCHLPADLKHFRELTTGNTIIMGRKTFESLPNGALPKRENIVLTKNKNVSFPDTLIFNTLDSALNYCSDKDKVFIIGGAMLYEEELNLADTLYLTFIHHKFEKVDAFFPQIDNSEWEITDKSDFDADENNKFTFYFITTNSFKK